jgi:hypothetical protein
MTSTLRQIFPGGFLAEIDRHGAAKEIDDTGVRQLQFAHFFLDGELGGIRFQRFQNIRVGLGITAKEQADKRDGAAQVREIQFPPERVFRLTEFKDEDAPAGFGDAEHFGQAGFPTGQVPQAVTDGDGVKGVIGKGELLGIAVKEFQVLGRKFGSLEAGLGDFEHFFAEIQADGLCAALGEGEGDVAGAATEVESAVAGLDLGEVDDAAFPKTMKAEALQVVQQVVTARDGGKEVADLGGALFARGVKSIGHARSLSRRMVANQSG